MWYHDHELVLPLWYDMERKHSKFYIGPAGWSYPDWEGIFYPSKSRIDRLKLVASRFNCIEINSSFYRIPSKRIVKSWAERAGAYEGFLFTAKAWQGFSHDRKLERSEVISFIDALVPLSENDLLGAILLQFPWSFRYNRDNKQYLKKIAAAFSGLPLAVEVRHGSWNSEEALGFIKDSGMAFCNIDQPIIGNSLPPASYATREDFAYIRLHGRNAREWFRKDAGRDERYNYLYTMEELNEWKERALEIARKVERVFIITNNHFRGQAIVNAFQIRFLLEGQKQAVPQSLLRTYPQLNEISLEGRIQGELEI